MPDETDNSVSPGLNLSGGMCEQEGMQCNPDFPRACQFLDIAGVVMVGLDPNGIITFANQKALEVLEHERENLLGRNWFDTCVPSESRAMIRDVFGKIMRGDLEGVEYVRNEVITGKGNLRTLSWFNTYLKEGDRIVGTLSSGEDITEKLETEEQLRLRSLAMEQSSEGIAIIDLEGTILMSNRAFADMHGWSPNELTGRHFSILHTPEQMGSVNAANQEIEAHGSFSGEIWHAKRDGGVFPTHMLNTLLRDGAGEPIGIIGTMRDITELKDAEEKRLELERQVLHSQKLESLGILAGGVAHDFNNLLMAIIGNVDIARQELADDSMVGLCVKEIETAAVRASELCRQMLAYSGKGRLDIQLVDICSLVREMANLLDVSIPKKVDLVLDLAQDTPPLHGDPTQLRQVVMNLITNAAEAIGDETGAVRVSSGPLGEGEECASGEPGMSGPALFLEITDTGCGMPSEVKDRVFDPFFSTKFRGRGLGLAAVQGIVRSHDGVIEVESTVGRGTTMRLCFPAAEEAEPPPSSKQVATAGWLGSGTVLLVDDEDQVLNSVGRMLERLGFEVLKSPDGEDAIDQLEREGDSVRFVILDVAMPRLDGPETLREIRQRGFDIPVVLTSGHDEAGALAAVDESEIAGFLQKPFRVANLRTVVRKIIDG